MPPIWLLVWTLAGALFWTLLEYFLHRELGHRHTRNPFGAEHVRHHATTHYFAPSWKKAAVAAPIIAGLGAVLAWQLGAAASGFALGLGAMYVVYEVLHRRAHTHAPRGRYGRWIRRHHFHHHFHAPHKNHGVTTPVWDLVFGTLERPGVIRVPEKHALSWLVDAAGDVPRPLSGDYMIVRRWSAEARPSREPQPLGLNP